MTAAPDRVRHRHPRGRARAPPRAAARPRARGGSQRLRPLRRALRPLLQRPLVPLDGAPVAFAQGADGAMAVFVPEFEVERVRAETAFENVESYPEYPGVEHPMAILARVLDGLGVGGRIGADQDGYPGILGYRGPGAERGDGRDADVARASRSRRCWRARARRSSRSSARARAGASMRTGCCRSTRVPGATEAEASLRAGHEATLALLAAEDGEVGGVLSSSDGVQAGYRGQIGSRSSWAHAIAHNIEFRPATSSSRRRAPRSGATTRSSSGRW